LKIKRKDYIFLIILILNNRIGEAQIKNKNVVEVSFLVWYAVSIMDFLRKKNLIIKMLEKHQSIYILDLI